MYAGVNDSITASLWGQDLELWGGELKLGPAKLEVKAILGATGSLTAQFSYLLGVAHRWGGSARLAVTAGLNMGAGSYTWKPRIGLFSVILEGSHKADKPTTYEVNGVEYKEYQHKEKIELIFAPAGVVLVDDTSSQQPQKELTIDVGKWFQSS